MRQKEAEEKDPETRADGMYNSPLVACFLILGVALLSRGLVPPRASPPPPAVSFGVVALLGDSAACFRRPLSPPPPIFLLPSLLALFFDRGHLYPTPPSNNGRWLIVGCNQGGSEPSEALEVLLMSHQMSHFVSHFWGQ